MIKLFLPLLLTISQCLFAQKTQSYAGHFVDREGHTNLIIKDNGSTFEVDLTKDGGYHNGHARQKDGILDGFFTYEKDTTSFNILMQENTLLLTSQGYHLTLNKADDYEYEAPTSYDFPVKKVVLEIPFPTGNRMFSNNGKIAFNLPDENWEATEQDGVFILQKEGARGWLKVFPHDIKTMNEAHNHFNINELYPSKIELVQKTDYGKRGIFRTYKGLDNDNQNIKFHLLTIVGLEGRGVHIFSGSHLNYFKNDYEIWAKMIANSLELMD